MAVISVKYIQQFGGEDDGGNNKLYEALSSFLVDKRISCNISQLILILLYMQVTYQ